MSFHTVFIGWVLPLILIVLSIPLLLQKIPPNGVYGFRMSKTMSSDEMWYRANKLGAMYFIGAGLFGLVVGMVAIFVWGDAYPKRVTNALAVLQSVSVAVATLLWWLQVRKL